MHIRSETWVNKQELHTFLAQTSSNNETCLTAEKGYFVIGGEWFWKFIIL